ncbi:MAG: PIG-L deacetylase family protein [Rhizobiaceae bacterium]
MRILAIGAHPDDLEIYAFGTLGAWVEMGARLTLAVATDGARGGALPAARLRDIRQRETIAALAPLGCGEPVMLGFADGALSSTSGLHAALTDLVADSRPDLILTHAANDYHEDHRALSAAVDAAANFTAPVLAMDTMNGTGFAPTFWVDVTRHWPAKEQAIRTHQSQDPERFIDACNRQGAFRAGECNGSPQSRAEAFRYEPRFPFADIRALLPPAPPLSPIRPRGPRT